MEDTRAHEGQQSPSGFIIPSPVPPRDRYVAKPIHTGGEIVVNVFEILTETGEDTRKQVAEYTRDYRTFYRTFEPFRQFKNGMWKNYAAISDRYTRLAVLDLETGLICAVEKPDEKTMQLAERVKQEGGEHYRDRSVEDIAAGYGFCPVDIYVPDWWEIHDGSIGVGSPYWSEKYERLNGSFGFYCGCHWGDDDSWKLQHIDLSAIDQGIILTDDRFGYVPISNKLTTLKDSVFYMPTTDRLEVAVQVTLNRQTGQANANYIDLHWTKEDEE